jgi:hypothetical protein
VRITDGSVNCPLPRPAGAKGFYFQAPRKQIGAPMTVSSTCCEGCSWRVTLDECDYTRQLLLKRITDEFPDVAISPHHSEEWLQAELMRLRNGGRP